MKHETPAGSARASVFHRADDKPKLYYKPRRRATLAAQPAARERLAASRWQFPWLREATP